MKESVIVNFDDEFVYAESLVGPSKGTIFKIPKERVRPNDWIAIGEHIWHVEHNYWNFTKMFDKH